MLTAFVAAIAFGATAPQTIDLTPTDDIWVYPHASDPEKDGYLRCWGIGSASVAPNPEESDEFSYSYLKFDLAKLPKDAKVKEAKLILWHVPDPVWTLDVAKASPLEVRVLKQDFAEKKWGYEMVRTINPSKGKESVYGSFFPEKLTAGVPLKFEVDLLKTPGLFEKSVKEATDGKLGLALTSTLDPSELGQRAVYKFYSKDYEKTDVKPALKLVVE